MSIARCKHFTPKFLLRLDRGWHLLQNYGGVSYNVYLQGQSTGRPTVSADHGMPEQRPHGLLVMQRAWDPSRDFLQLGKPSEKESLL